MRYLAKVAKTGAFKFQRGIPKELRPFFPSKGTTWRENLHTKDLQEARLKCLDAAQRVEKAFQAARAQLAAEHSGSPSFLPPVHELASAVHLWKEQERYRRAARLMSGYAAGAAEFHRECRLTQALGRPTEAEEPEDYVQRLKAEHEVIQGWVDDLVSQEGWALPEDHSIRQMLWTMVRQEWLEILRLEHRWRALDFTDMPTAPPAIRTPSPHPSSASPPSSFSPRLSEGFEDWAKTPRARESRHRVSRTIIEGRLAVRRFVELHGDMRIGEINRGHARSYRDAIAKLPGKLPKALDRLPLPELLKRDLSAYRPRTAATINKSLNLLRAIASRADNEGHLDEVGGWRNPFDVRLETDPLAEVSYEPFDRTDLNRLFASPVFAKGERPRRGRNEAAKWLPLMALLHGARRGELIQLRVCDVVVDPDTSIRYLRISPRLEEGKRVKNLGSIRKTPLHPKAIELGFLDYWEMRSASGGGEASLWEGLDTESRIKLWAEWFHGYLSAHGIDHPKKRFHSFRHTFKRFARDHLDSALIDALCGHVSGVAGRYGKTDDGSGKDSGYSLTALKRAIAKVEFEGVDFSAILSVQPIAAD